MNGGHLSAALELWAKIRAGLRGKLVEDSPAVRFLEMLFEDMGHIHSWKSGELASGNKRENQTHVDRLITLMSSMLPNRQVQLRIPTQEATLCPTGSNLSAEGLKDEESENEVFLAETPPALDHAGGDSGSESELEMIPPMVPEIRARSKESKPTRSYSVYTYFSQEPKCNTRKMTKTDVKTGLKEGVFL